MSTTWTNQLSNVYFTLIARTALSYRHCDISDVVQQLISTGADVDRPTYVTEIIQQQRFKLCISVTVTAIPHKTPVHI